MALTTRNFGGLKGEGLFITSGMMHTLLAVVVVGAGASVVKENEEYLQSLSHLDSEWKEMR